MTIPPPREPTAHDKSLSDSANVVPIKGRLSSPELLELIHRFDAAARLIEVRAITPEDAAGQLRQAVREIDQLEDRLVRARHELARADWALQQIVQWADGYPETAFGPVTLEQVTIAHAVLRQAGISLGAIHAQWARQLTETIGGIARAALHRNPEPTGDIP